MLVGVLLGPLVLVGDKVGVLVGDNVGDKVTVGVNVGVAAVIVVVLSSVRTVPPFIVPVILLAVFAALKLFTLRAATVNVSDTVISIFTYTIHVLTVGNVTVELAFALAEPPSVALVTDVSHSILQSEGIVIRISFVANIPAPPAVKVIV